MHRYPDKVVKKIREIRKKESLSYAQLSRTFNIASTTIGYWCSDIKKNRYETLLKSNEKKRHQIKQSELNVIPKIKSINTLQAKFIASMLYGCEGSKYPAHSGVSFANSNPLLVLGFVKLLRKSFILDENKFSVHLQIHTNHNYNSLKKYWSKLLNIPENSFIKPTVRPPGGGKHRNGYIGTCTLRYRDYRIQLKILGIFEGFINRLSGLT